MKGYLLDANLLIALAWPNHAHHAKAHEWLAHVSSMGWGTCTVTQLAFVRVSSHPKVEPHVSPQEAIEKLRQILALPAHSFWPEPPGGFNHTAFGDTAVKILSHGLVTDGYLATVAKFNSGILATLDKQLAHTFPEFAVHVGA
jgi:toxin-antitoxin system PIN domain toxin